MSVIENILKKTAACVVFGTGALVVTAVAPVVSAVALPIFALKAIPTWINYKIKYNRTLTNGQRERYGRVPGQDYTRWDGRAVEGKSRELTKAEKSHEKLNAYIHGRENLDFKNNLSPWVRSSFNTSEDVQWLDNEIDLRKAKVKLDADIRMIQIFAVSLVPIIGWMYAFVLATSVGGPSSMGCSVCLLDGKEDKHWGWGESLSYHKKLAEDSVAAEMRVSRGL